jgi:hypothetical protein
MNHGFANSVSKLLSDRKQFTTDLANRAREFVGSSFQIKKMTESFYGAGRKTWILTELKTATHFLVRKLTDSEAFGD